MTKPDISIIILTWNHLEDVTKPFIQDLYVSLEKTPVSHEVIILDNGSSDGTIDWLREQHLPHTILMHSAKNLGFSGGNNQALKKAKGEYVIFLNNDVVVTSPLWLEKYLQAFTFNPKSLVGCQLEDTNSLTAFRGEMTPYIVGWSLGAPMEFLSRTGGWNSDFGLGYFEDVEMSFRASHAGYQLQKINAGLRHLGSKSSWDQLDIDEQTKTNRAIYRNILYTLEKGTHKRIVFYYPKNWAFTPPDYWKKGVGGSESALLGLTKELAKKGHIVEVYNDTLIEGKFDGVYYYNCRSFEYHDYADVFVLFRNSMTGFESVHAGTRLFWSCDQQTTCDWEEKIIPYADKIITISEYHRHYLIGRYPLKQKQCVVLDIGVRGEEYEERLPKVPGKLIFCSVPRRGLEYLEPIYRKLQEVYPTISLYITSDYTLWGSKPQNEEFKEQFKSLRGVHFLGNIDRKTLVEHQKTAQILAYPCIYDENFCVSAMECIAAGTIPVTTAVGALPTTVGESGYFIQGKPEQTKFQELFVAQVLALLQDDALRTAKSDACYERGKNYYWSNLVTAWETMFMSQLPQKPTLLVCTTCYAAFPDTYHLFKHRIEKHSPKPIELAKSHQLEVKIETTRYVEAGINENTYAGTSFVVPKATASGLIAILVLAYGEDIIKRTEIRIRE